jgi:hemoglobin
MTPHPDPGAALGGRRPDALRPSSAVVLSLSAVALCWTACFSEPTTDREFHTSGSPEADQRAEQRVEKVQQARGEKAADAEDAALPPLYDRLGGAEGVRKIVDDFVDRALADPRVNWERKGVTSGSVLGLGGKEMEWRPTPENLELLKDRMAQFVAVASGGPTRYEGRDLVAVHAGMAITNAEFDGAMGALKATVDALGVATAEQKELLAIMESARPQIAEER